MATKLRMIYVDNVGTTTTHTYSYANPETTSTQVAALSAATITNGDIFQRLPVSLKSATIVTTTETDLTPTPNP